MIQVTVHPSQTELGLLLHSLKANSEPMRLSGGEVNAVLLTEEEWNNIQETLFLSAIPGMKESIIEGMNTPIAECSDTVEL